MKAIISNNFSIISTLGTLYIELQRLFKKCRNKLKVNAPIAPLLTLLVLLWPLMTPLALGIQFGQEKA